jgi:hypothetical protein
VVSMVARLSVYRDQQGVTRAGGTALCAITEALNSRDRGVVTELPYWPP